MSETLKRLLLGAAGMLLLSACATSGPGGGSSMSPTTSLAASPKSTTASPSSTRPDVRPTLEPGTHSVIITDQNVPMPEIPSVTLPETAPKRIVSLAKGVGETLAALGVGDRVVGRDEASNVQEIASAPIVTKAHATSSEKVLSLNPDLVLIDKSTAPKEAIDQIRDSGVKVVEIPEAWTLADIKARTQAVAEAAMVPQEVTDKVILEATSGVSETDTGAKPKVVFLYVRGTSAIYLVGGKGSGADALLAAAGARDMGAEAGLDAFTPLTAEAVAGMNPDVILVMTKGLESVGGIDGLTALPGVAQTKAGKEKRVVAVDDTLLLSFGPRTGQLVEALEEALEESME